MKITILNKALCGVVEKNIVKNQQITRTVVLPAPLTFCVKINRLPAGNWATKYGTFKVNETPRMKLICSTNNYTVVQYVTH